MTPWRHPFLAPWLLAAMLVGGLVTALRGDGAWDAVGCALIGAALAAGVWRLLRAR